MVKIENPERGKVRLSVHSAGLAGYLAVNRMKRWQNLFIFDNKDRMAEFMIRKWEEIAKESIEKKGYVVAALSGGKTPVTFYKTLAEEREMLPWHRTHLFLVDERFLPFDDENSNYRMLRETLLSKIEIPEENIHPIPTGRSTPFVSADAYEEDLKTFFRLRSGQFPRFDLVLLGIGEEGHTASLFPGSPLLNEKDRLAVAVILDEISHHRITLTLPVINHAKEVFFLVSGEEKAPVLEKVLNKRDSFLPASMINPDEGKLFFLSDSEAASEVMRTD
jgi:6-phosphogluconolactonase